MVEVMVAKRKGGGGLYAEKSRWYATITCNFSSPREEDRVDEKSDRAWVILRCRDFLNQGFECFWSHKLKFWHDEIEVIGWFDSIIKAIWERSIWQAFKRREGFDLGEATDGGGISNMCASNSYEALGKLESRVYVALGRAGYEKEVMMMMLNVHDNCSLAWLNLDLG